MNANLTWWIVVLTFAAAIITIAANSIQLYANIIAAKAVKRQNALTDRSKPTADNISDGQYLLRHFRRKQKSSLLSIIVLLLLPFVEAKLNGELTPTFFVVTVHCILLFYVILYVMMKTAISDLVKETTKNKESGNVEP